MCLPARLPAFLPVQLPDCFYWELQYRPLIPSHPPGACQQLQVHSGELEAEVGGLDPGTKYAFRWVGEAAAAAPLLVPLLLSPSR